MQVYYIIIKKRAIHIYFAVALMSKLTRARASPYVICL